MRRRQGRRRAGGEAPARGSRQQGLRVLCVRKRGPESQRTAATLCEQPPARLRQRPGAEPRPPTRGACLFAPPHAPSLRLQPPLPPTHSPGNARLLGSALDSDCIIEPARAPLIPGMQAVKEAAKAAGAYGCTISGAGPTAVAVVSDPGVGARVADAMAAAFRSEGRLEINSKKVVRLDPEGAKFV